ncbi:hypothetical protein P691DRAFT_678274 [Macrolepiota fuliginosa MF-IS2]|uniref:P-loop containing nucleoside triphosphate hydrolase protein n=1 Tax=Macrolepiota fuliginosa MF-IS2 TaxID=1400762 RepID=A0A9P5X6J0_9AGAR|nr:hypothetical protein P691DRAFT_678274 [Macrolepiota fuliginosa MF-IS2]
MPSHTVASALIKLFSLNGAPWEWSTWQELTGIQHGLFPTDDNHLPRGWTRKDADDVKSYFHAYGQLKTEDDKFRFATKTQGSAEYPGRVTWNSFISRNWSRWGIHNLIVQELRDWDIHPMSILVREDDLSENSWPSSDSLIPIILDTLGTKVFGEDAFHPGSLTLRMDVRRFLQIFAQRSWNTIRSQVAGLRSRQDDIEAAAVAAFADLEKEKATKAKVNRVICAVAKWKQCAELFHTPENLKKAEDMLANLQEILEGLGVKLVKKRRVGEKASGTCKVSAKALQSMASEEDANDLLMVYQEYFETGVDEDDEPPITDILPEHRELMDKGGDFGMEAEKNLSFDKLALRLGFKTGLPPLFNTLRHRSSGISPWEDENLFNANVPHPDLIPMALHWHQLAGTHSMVRSLFTAAKDGAHTTGVLIADEVGLGKTAQSVTVIGFLNQVIWLQREGRKLPPVVAERPYLGGSTKVPSQAHLIICPGTLTAQWVSELKTLFRPKKVDILVYDSQTSSEEFWGSSGPFHSSKHDPHNRIVVASESVLYNDMKKTHKAPDRRGARPWDIPEAKGSLAGTIFGQSFLMVIIDEAHHMRNVGNKHAAALRVLQQTRIRLIMTATPLHTAPKDAASLARLVGVPHFFDEVSFIEEKADAGALRKAKKLDDNKATLLAEELRIVRRHQAHCIGHFLRRTTKSRDWEGEVLLPLPPYTEIPGILALTERENGIMQKRAEAAKAEVLSSSSSTTMQTKKFYLEYRTAVGYAKEDPADPWPTFKTREEWDPVKSTKMDVCGRISFHYLTRDDVPDVEFHDGKLVLPEVPPLPEKDIRKTRRIIIYAEFASMAPLLQNVLQLHGVECLIINGTMSFDQRDRRVKEFYSDKHPARVLVFSSVGCAGLNLAIADVVIFFDQPWSAQDERQIIGRAHRQPQKKPVKVIYLLARDSADVMMNRVAGRKRNMFDAFVNKDLAEGTSYYNHVR